MSGNSFIASLYEGGKSWSWERRIVGFSTDACEGADGIYMTVWDWFNEGADGVTDDGPGIGCCVLLIVCTLK